MLLCAAPRHSAGGGNFTLQATADNAIALRKHRKHILGVLVQPSLRKSHQMTEWRSSIEKMNFERAIIVEVIKLLRHRKTTG
jgi:hypothetical protein